MSNDDVRQGYNKVADEYLKQRDQFTNNKYLDKLAELLPKSATVLDVGCGAGVPIDSYLINKGYKVIGIDISEKQIELAKKNNPQGEYKVQDMSKLNGGEYEVDAVVSFYAIFHTKRETHLDLLKKINSFLPKNGYLLITMGSSDWEGKEDDFYGGTMEWSHYNADKNRELVKRSGFEIIFDEIDTSGEEKHLVILAKKN